MTLLIYYATPGILIEIRFRIIIELIAFNIPQSKDRHDPRKILNIKFVPKRAWDVSCDTYSASSAISRVSSDKKPGIYKFRIWPEDSE
jgi:hypothetical protein